MAGLVGEPTRRFTVREGTRLACVDYGGAGSAVVLLHGLAGNAREWDETASWLVASHRVVAIDARGHGYSERRPDDVSRAAHVADVVHWLQELDVAPVHLVGQSLGGHTAFLVAARHRNLVSSLIVAEATPWDERQNHEAVERWLASWPVPFESYKAAIAFFGGDTLWARAWVSGLEMTSAGLAPRFDLDVMIRSLEEGDSSAYWEEWSGVRVPSLVLRAEHGVPRREALRMIQMQPDACLVEIAQAQNDLHLEKPSEWRRAVESFLKQGEVGDGRPRAGRVTCTSSPK